MSVAFHPTAYAEVLHDEKASTAIGFSATRYRPFS
jgi:hypothetical protein